MAIVLDPIQITATSSNAQEAEERRIFDKRVWRVNVAGADMSLLSTSFQIEKSKRPEPNSCKIEIYNLNKDSRDYIQSISLNQKQNSKGTGKGSFKQVGAQSGNIRVEIEAGYRDVGTSLLFRGDLRTASSERQRTDIVTTIFGEDGGYSSLTARVQQGFPEGTPIENVARFCAARMGVGVGNLPAVFRGGLPGLNLPSLMVYEEGTILSGSPLDELRLILANLGVGFSIQDGAIQCRAQGGYIPATRVLLSPTTGLVGSPIKDANGYVRATCLIQPGLFVDGRVRFESEDFLGDYVIHTVKYDAETFGKNWYAHIETKP